MYRRQALWIMGATVAGCAAPFLNRGRFALFAQSSETYSTRCIDLIHRSLVIDMLSQFKLGAFPDVLADHDRPTARWWSHPETFTAADLARYRESAISVFNIGWGTGRVDPYRGVLAVIHAWKRFVEYHQNDFAVVTSIAEMDALKPRHKIGILLGFQGSDHFRSADDVDFFWHAGQRVSQLTYNLCNAIGCGYEVKDTGLTPFGLSIVARMNSVGMAIDLSHCGPRTTMEAIERSERPVLFTHANCKALNPHARNKSDAAIRKLAAKGGVMGISSVRMMVSAQEPTTIENVLDHYDHVARLVGVEHVGVGSDIDLDGYDKLPPSLRAKMLTGYKNSPAFRGRGDIDGLNHPQRVFDLTEGLIRRRYSDGDIENILGGNFRRALGQTWPGAAS
jgi:membrane dipeptidase